MPVITPREISSAITASTKPTETPDLRQLDTTVDPAVDAAAVPAPSEEQLSPKFAEIARKEKALRQKWKELEAKEASQKVDEPVLQAKYEAAFKDSLKARFADDLLGSLAEFGISQEQLTETLLNPRAPLPPEVRQMREELQALKDQQSQALKAQEEQRTKAMESAVSQVRSEAKSLVETDERFELIKAMDASEAVVELILETYNTSGKLISTEEAAGKVEEYLGTEAERIARLNKVQAKLKPQEPAPAVPGTTQMKTLTNRVEQTPTRSLNAKQRMENAIAIAEGRPKPY